MEKNNLHPRNRHKSRYDFKKLTNDLPELKKYIVKNKFNNEDTVDFSNPEAVKSLNRAILKSFYGIQSWDIPPDYLCPPIPGRADYIHYAADLLSTPYRNEKMRVLDIGTGANCVYPLIGSSEYGWNFVGSDIDPLAIVSAQKIINENNLNEKIQLRMQASKDHIFSGIIQPDDRFDLVICNPPFHSSASAAKEGSDRKNKNLGLKSALNFGGQNNELWCVGGEKEFIKKMILESFKYRENCRWFSTLVSAKENLSGVYGEIKRVGGKDVQTFEMKQGQKTSRFVAWTF